jgi:hypothetical protein
MTSRAILLTSGLLLLAAIAVAGDATRSAAEASDEAIRSYFRSLSRTSNESDVTGTANARGAPGAVPLTAAASHAHAARIRFNEARVAMERQLLLREAAPKNNMTALETAMIGLHQEMTLFATTSQPGASDAVKKALTLSQDWYQAGLKIIKPPAEGLLELPLPMVVASKGDAAAAAFDEVVREASASRPQRAAAPAKKRARVSSRPAAGGVHAIAASGLLRETPH